MADLQEGAAPGAGSNRPLDAELFGWLKLAGWGLIQQSMETIHENDSHFHNATINSTVTRPAFIH
jgi:hypothetical protein